MQNSNIELQISRGIALIYFALSANLMRKVKWRETLLIRLPASDDVFDACINTT